METDIAIDIKNVSKIYKMYERPVNRLKESLSFGRRNYHKDFYALDHVNFQVKKGDTVGIIGRNGAGKSTLLKIITGVLAPSSGEVKVNGKISSLLELGAGFNPEFTGIENIYLNGTVMGFSRKEMDAKLKNILEFADIGDFVHQPVKTYSSGMYVRLAFSVAINVEPDVLIVDEALAVGDAKFQLKCFKRLEDLKKSGITIFFVSHSTEQVKDLCKKALLLENGKVIYEGDPKEASVKYFDLIFPKTNQNSESEYEKGKDVNSCIDNLKSSMKKNAFTCFPEKMTSNNQNFGVGGAKIDWIEIYGTNGTNVFSGGESIVIRVKYSWDIDFLKEIQLQNNLAPDVGIGIALADGKGNYVFGCNNFDKEVIANFKENDTYIFELKFIMPYLRSGAYFITAAISVGTQSHHVQLKWYDYFLQMECMSSRKNVYGIMHLDYEMNLLEK